VTRTRILAALAALAVGLTLAGAGTAAGFTDAAARPAPAPVTVAARTTGSTSATTAAPPSGTGGTTGDEAGRIAVRHLGDGSVTRAERSSSTDVRCGTSTCVAATAPSRCASTPSRAR
jgi:hypothetical protein